MLSEKEQLARVRQMTDAELRRQIAQCAAHEERHGIPNKARRTWKIAKDYAKVELVRRTGSAA